MREDTCFQQAAAFQLIPSEDGVFFETDGRTRFCLCAPKASSLTVSLPGGPSWPPILPLFQRPARPAGQAHRQAGGLRRAKAKACPSIRFKKHAIL